MRFSFNSNIFPDNSNAFLVGGCVRDILLDRSPMDYDIAVSSNPVEFAEKLAIKTSGHLVFIGKNDKRLIRVVAGSHIFDILPVYGGSIEADLKNRDFTINAMAFSLDSGKLIDCIGGQKDLINKIVRLVSEKAFLKDPLRMLRAFRIASENNFEIEPSSLSSIKKYSYLLKNQAGERIKAEIFKLLKTTCSYPYLMQLINSGPINEILPELINLKHCSQNRHHSYDVFDHTLKSYSHMENIIANLSTIISDPSSPVHRHLNEHKKALIKWTILLHDIGKPFVKSEDEEGNIHFYGHAAKSAEIAEIISKRLRFSNYEAGHVDIVVRNHNRPLYLFNLYKKNQFKKKHLTRFFLSCDEYVPDILLHGIADHKGKAPDSDNEFVDFLLNAIKNFYLDFKSAKSRPRLLTGNDLIRVFGLKPSPAFKTVLKYIEEERLSGHIHKKEEAIKIAEEFLMNSKNSNP